MKRVHLAVGLFGLLTVSASVAFGQNAQSPISIPLYDLTYDDLDPLEFDYSETAELTVYNPGHGHDTVEAALIDNGDGTLTIGDTDYEFVRFHFHYTSEHLVSFIDEDLNFIEFGYDMELHMVHREIDNHDNNLVVGRWIREGEEHEELDDIFDDLDDLPFAIPFFDLNTLLPEESKRNRTYRYSGSLTTGAAEPYLEGVEWVMFDDVMEMSEEQIDAFFDVFGENFREVQPLKNRLVYTEVPEPSTLSLIVLIGLAAWSPTRRTASRRSKFRN